MQTVQLFTCLLLINISTVVGAIVGAAGVLIAQWLIRCDQKGS